MDTGVARRPIPDMDAYREALARRLDPTAGFLQKISGAVQSGRQKRIVFAEGEEPQVIRAAYAFQTQGLGKAVLIGREELVTANMRAAGLDPAVANLEVLNARLSPHVPELVDYLYGRLQRHGYLRRDVLRLINQDRNSFSSSLVALGYADGMVTGVTRNFDQALEEVLRWIDPAPGGRVLGMSIVLSMGRTIFIAVTNVVEMPEAYWSWWRSLETARRSRCATWASPRAWPSCPIRPSATRWATARRRCARRWRCWTRAATSASSTRAKCRPRSPSIPSSGGTTPSCA